MAKAEPPPHAAPPAAPAAVAAKGGGWLVQLGALRSEADAKTAWAKVRGAHGDLLGQLTSDIVRVELGDKGVFWRVRAGPLNEAQARTLCSALTKQGQGCLIVQK